MRQGKYKTLFSNHVWKDKGIQCMLAAAACLLLVAIFAPLLAGHTALVIKKEGSWEFPILKASKTTMDYKRESADLIVLPLIPFSSSEIPKESKGYLSPGSTVMINNREYKHILGTDRLGRDVLAGLIRGCRRSLSVALLSGILACCLGGIIGLLSGFWGNQDLKIKRGHFFILFAIFIYVLFLISNALLSPILALVLIGTFVLILFWIPVRSNKKFNLPIDWLALRGIEIIKAIPALILIMAFNPVLIRQSNILLFSMMISFLTWPIYARLIRGEVIKRKANDFVIGAKIGGQSPGKIMFSYLLPEIIGPIIVQFAFHLAQIILLESALSFLGIGLPLTEVTWGSCWPVLEAIMKPGGLQFFRA